MNINRRTMIIICESQANPYRLSLSQCLQALPRPTVSFMLSVIHSPPYIHHQTKAHFIPLSISGMK